MAAEVEVKMLNNGPLGAMTFDPALVQIQPGDSVHFIAADKGHDVESVPDMLPAGAVPFKGTISQDLTVTFDVEGVYAYKCLPHFPMGMVGLVVVGKSSVNLDAVKAGKFPPLAQKRLDTLYAQITQ